MAEVEYTLSNLGATKYYCRKVRSTANYDRKITQDHDETHGMDINIAKTIVMVTSRKQQQTTIRLDNTMVEQV